MDKAKRKRVVIVAVYLTILFLIIWGIYYFKFRQVPSCIDGIRNQNEEGVDCGGICLNDCAIPIQELSVGKMGVVPSGILGKYDFYVQVTNPNATYGNKNFYYSLDLKDSGGNVVASRDGSGFILPGERKYIIESNIDSSTMPANFDFVIKDSDWVELNEYYQEPELQIVNKSYDEVSGGVGFSEAYGLLKNRSPFDFDLINVEILLKDTNGDVLAINSTQMKTVAAGEQRDFKVSWPNRFPGTVANMETQADVNVFKAETFMKKFYKTEKFQEY